MRRCPRYSQRLSAQRATIVQPIAQPIATPSPLQLSESCENKAAARWVQKITTMRAPSVLCLAIMLGCSSTANKSDNGNQEGQADSSDRDDRFEAESTCGYHQYVFDKCIEKNPSDPACVPGGEARLRALRCCGRHPEDWAMCAAIPEDKAYTHCRMVSDHFDRCINQFSVENCLGDQFDAAISCCDLDSTFRYCELLDAPPQRDCDGEEAKYNTCLQNGGSEQSCAPGGEERFNVLTKCCGGDESEFDVCGSISESGEWEGCQGLSESFSDCEFIDPNRCLSDEERPKAVSCCDLDHTFNFCKAFF
jgi:hypothetical protein